LVAVTDLISIAGNGGFFDILPNIVSADVLSERCFQLDEV
jgi:hypothetical protein